MEPAERLDADPEHFPKGRIAVDKVQHAEFFADLIHFALPLLNRCRICTTVANARRHASCGSTRQPNMASAKTIFLGPRASR